STRALPPPRPAAPRTGPRRTVRMAPQNDLPKTSNHPASAPFARTVTLSPLTVREGLEGQMIGETAVEAADPAALVLRVVAIGDDDAVLQALDAVAVELIETDLIHRLVPSSVRLATIDYRDHPWAALLAGVALCSFDRPLGRGVLRTAREQFASAGDDRGHGY